jgi:hydroxypyruvate reductase
MDEVRRLLRDLFDAAVTAGRPEQALPAHLPAPPRGRTLVLGAGKAAAAMARVVEQHWTGELSGLVVTRYGQALDCGRIEVVEAAHPVPDAAGVEAARRSLALAGELGPDDLALCLVSGGGSSLLTLPAPGISLEEIQQLNQQLLRCGAGIAEINTVRKHVSGIKGGRLAKACAPARILSLLISDVPGDAPQLIASGPTVPDDSTSAEALAILERYRVAVPPSMRSFLESPASGTPPATDPCFERSDTRVVAGPQVSLQAAAALAESRGVPALILSDSIEGESRDVGKALAAIARQVKYHGQPIRPPCVLLSGGETTVTLRGEGRGGPNTEFNLGLALALAGEPGISALACDTDGIDGSEDNAGCFVDALTLARAAEAGLDPHAALVDNDAWSFFHALGDLVVTGPTHTNVNDFRAIYIA